jgi:alcohol dehydrogenase/L-iditol 2-dehydrogenase
VPDRLPFEQACLTEPCCVAFNAVVENTRLKPADRVIVLGPGTIGILCAAAARMCGAEVAIVRCDGLLNNSLHIRLRSS